MSGPLDFDNATGEAVSDIAMWCLRQDGDAISFDPPLESYYSASDRAVVRSNPPLDLTQSDWCKPARN